MKNLSICILIVFACTTLKAQIYVEGVQLDNTNTGSYIIMKRGGLGTPFIIDVDYGQPQKPVMGYTRLTDENAEAIKFRTIVGALNFFDKNGWEVIDIGIDSDVNDSNYLLRKKRT